MVFPIIQGYRNSATENAFRKSFGSNRRTLDLHFFAMQCLVNGAYFRHTTSAWHVAWLFGASFLPTSIYLLIPNSSKQKWRTRIIIGLKLCMVVYVGKAFNNDYFPSQTTHNWPVFLHNLGFACRALPFLGTHLGLQLPFALDFPIMVLAVCIMAATKIPSQCWPGPLPEGTATLLAVNRTKLETLVELLDWPFGLIPHNPTSKMLELEHACAAVCTWMLLVFALGIPAAVLLIAECKERARFSAQVGRSNEARGTGVTQHAAAEGSALGASQLAEFSARLCRIGDPCVTVLMGVLAAELLWCVLRTVVLL